MSERRAQKRGDALGCILLVQPGEEEQHNGVEGKIGMQS